MRAAQMRPFGEYRAAVKRGRGCEGLGLQRSDLTVTDRTRLPLVVAQEDGKAFDPLDQRRHIDLVKLLIELNGDRTPKCRAACFRDCVPTVVNAGGGGHGAA